MTFNTNKPIQLINCDWLQFHGKHVGFSPDNIESSTNYRIKSLGHGTRVFRDVYEVYEKSSITKSHRDELFATICVHPHSSILDANMYVCKIENKVLYQPNLYGRICSFIGQLQLIYEGITRADICVDLYEFASTYKDKEASSAIPITPLLLLSLYRKNRFIKAGSRRYCQWLTAPYSVSQVNGVVTHDLLSDEHITHSISWGGAESDVHVKMYNKSKELKDEKHKGYIKSYWKANGLCESRDVWRVEISITRRSKYLYDNSQDSVVPINLELMTKNAFLSEVFMALAHRHFKFKELVVGKSAKAAKEVVLFNIHDCRVFECATHESRPIAGRTAKVCANYLESLVRTTDFDELLPRKPYSKDVLEIAHETLTCLYEGLKALGITKKDEKRKTMAQLREEAEWLNQWRMLPAEIDGIPIHKIIDRYDADSRISLMEEIQLRRHELACHMMYLATEDI